MLPKKVLFPHAYVLIDKNDETTIPKDKSRLFILHTQLHVIGLLL